MQNKIKKFKGRIKIELSYRNKCKMYEIKKNTGKILITCGKFKTLIKFQN